MNTFNFDRFRHVLRWWLRISLRRLTAWTVGAAACVFLGEMAYVGYGHLEGRVIGISDFPSVFSVLMVVAILVGQSAIFSGVNDRRRRTALLMLPASSLEKFLAAVLTVSVVEVVAVFLAFAVGDSLRVGVCAVLWPHQVSNVLVDGVWTNYYSWSSAIPGLLEQFFPFLFRFVWWPMTVFLALLTVFTLSLYLLCGTLLRKYAFGITTLALLSTLLGFAYILTQAGVEHFSLFSYDDAVHPTPYISPYAYAGYVVLPLLAAVDYWAAYRIFKGFQIVTNKWTNYDFLKR